MNFIDYILLIFVLIGFILGYKDGLIRKIVGLLGLLVAIVLGITYSDILGEYLTPMFNNEDYLAKIISGILIFFGTIFVFALLKRLIHPFDKVNKFLNQLLGGVVGAIQILFVISVFLLLLNTINIPNEKDVNDSIFYGKVFSLLPSTIDFVLGLDFQTEGFLKDYIESSNNKELPEEFSNPIDIDTLLNNDD